MPVIWVQSSSAQASAPRVSSNTSILTALFMALMERAHAMLNIISYPIWAPGCGGKTKCLAALEDSNKVLFAASILDIILFQACIRHPRVKNAGQQPTSREFLGCNAKVASKTKKTNRKKPHILEKQSELFQTEFLSILHSDTFEKILYQAVQQQYEQQGIATEYCTGLQDKRSHQCLLRFLFLKSYHNISTKGIMIKVAYIVWNKKKKILIQFPGVAGLDIY